MTSKSLERSTCSICGKSFPISQLYSAELIRKEITEEIIKQKPDWSESSYICRADRADFRGRYVHSILQSERGELSDLETEVIQSLREHELVASNVEHELEQGWTFGERLTDRLATFGGSWLFLILFGFFLVLWVGMNSIVLLWKPLDPYPFIFLNLILSCLAAIQAPIIMMSQNRQEAKDRIRSQNDYQVNLKAELEIRNLHEKMDHLISHQWERLVKIQELQIELLSEISSK